jgi:hypothetical protein
MVQGDRISPGRQLRLESRRATRTPLGARGTLRLRSLVVLRQAPHSLAGAEVGHVDQRGGVQAVRPSEVVQDRLALLESSLDHGVMTTTRTRRHRLLLLLAAGTVAVLALAVAMVVPPALRQREAVERIRALGGAVTYDFELFPEWRQASSLHEIEWKLLGILDRRNLADPDHDGRAWLRRLLGPDLFHNVVSVNLAYICSGGFGQIQETSGIYHEDLAFLTRLSDLRRLWLHKEQACDRVLEHIRGLKGIDSLYLSDAKVTDLGMENLRALKSLRYLYLYVARIGDAGLAHLADLTKLRGITMYGTGCTDAGLVHLRKLTKLRELMFFGGAISGLGLKHLAGLTELEGLGLLDTGFADAGVEHLAPFRKLKVVHLGKTALTPEGEQRLREIVPSSCAIEITQPR